MKFKHVIWDWNGTLVDDTWLFVDIMNGVLKDRNLNGITLQDYRNVFDFPVEDYYLKLGFNFSEEAFKTAGLDFIKIYDTNVIFCFCTLPAKPMPTNGTFFVQGTTQ